MTDEGTTTTEQDEAAKAAEAEAAKEAADAEAAAKAAAEGDEGSGKDDLDLDGAKAALTKVRREAAAMRVRLRETEEKLAAAKTPEEVEAVKAEITKGNADEARALLVENVALRHGLPDDLASALKGDTREELDAHAKVLAQYAPSSEGGDESDLTGGLKPGGTGDGDTFDPRAEARALHQKRR